METYSIKGTSQTPTINLDLKNGTLEITGRSIPEDAKTFYKPLNDAVDFYLLSPKNTSTINLQFEYINTTSSIAILGILRKFEKIINSEKNVIINWNYEDEDMLESGEDYQKVLNLPIKLIQLKTNV